MVIHNILYFKIVQKKIMKIFFKDIIYNKNIQLLLNIKYIDVI